MIWIGRSSRIRAGVAAIPPRVLGAIIGVVVFLWVLGLLFRAWVQLVGSFGTPYRDIALFAFFPAIIALSSVAMML